MRFTTSAILAFAGISSAATTHKVIVGNGSLAYEPNTTYAAVGDTVVFHFYPRDHNVVQGAFSTPCQDNNGIYSGFVPSSSGQANETFHVLINNTQPIWFYCSQTTGSHCTNGMVGVINPPNGTNQTLAAYKAGAAKVSNSSYTQPTHVEGGVLVMRNTTNGTHASTTTTAHSSTGTAHATSSASGSAATTVTSRAVAAVATGAAGVVGAVAGGLAVLLL